MKNLFYLFAMSLTLLAHAADLGLSPSSLKLKVYKFSVSGSKPTSFFIDWKLVLLG